MNKLNTLFTVCILFVLASCAQPEQSPAHYDVIIRGGLVFDGSGSIGEITDIGITGDRIESLSVALDSTADQVINAEGLIVAPGFINMLSWATDSLVVDGRGLSDLHQGITLEVFGEGFSWGPLTPETRIVMQEEVNKGPIPYEIQWNTLGEYLQYLEDEGVSPNVASFVGATTIRVNTLGFEDREPNNEELEEMKSQVRLAMTEGALGLGSSLIYAPAFYAKTDELIELAKVVAEFDGMYISHMRSEANRLIESLDELITIAREAGVNAEVYHLKASGKENWSKMDEVYKKIETARAAGLSITANMYTYTAGSTGLDAAMPPWVQEGGYEAWAERLRDPVIRAKVAEEMRQPTDEWENLSFFAGPDGMMFSYFQNPELKQYTGKTLAEVAQIRESDPIETIIDLVIEDGTRVQTIYFLMSEEVVQTQLKYPWLSFGSDAGALDPEVAKKLGSSHPRAYGNFVRVIGKYVREEKVLEMSDAIRKLSHLPATNLKLTDRGLLKEGYFADVVIFNPDTVTDHATFEDPHQLATGIEYVLVNGVSVIVDGNRTGATPGRFVKGPGWVEPEG